jgi:hypothetical protein
MLIRVHLQIKEPRAATWGASPNEPDVQQQKGRESGLRILWWFFVPLQKP